MLAIRTRAAAALPPTGSIHRSDGRSQPGANLKKPVGSWYSKLTHTTLSKTLERIVASWGWGATSTPGAGAAGGDREAIRRDYLDALQLADRTDDYGPLVRIATS